MRLFFIFPVLFFILWLAVPGGAQELKYGYYPDGQLRYKGNFMDGKPVGEFLRYDQGGNLKARMNYRGDTVEAVLYSRQGAYTSAGRYVHQKKCGIWEYRKNGILIAQDEYCDNLLCGKSVRYSGEKTLLEQKYWREGKQDGEWSLYYADGQLRMQTFYLAGRLNGILKVYARDGKLRTQGEYKDNLKEGEWRFYDEMGELLSKQVYHAGIPENADELELEESRQLDALINSGKKIPDPAVFADDPEAYIRLTE